MTISSISAITSNYGHLNGVENMYYNYGLGGYGYGYGGGVWGTANAEAAKERVANNYDVFATQQGFRSKQGVESLDHTQQCLLIADDLKRGETDQVSERFDEMVKSMKNAPQYANYSETEICSLIRKEYTEATGSDLVVDIDKHASGAFIQGVKRAFPILGMAANKNSKADLIAQVTNNNKSKGEKLSKSAGYVTGSAVGAAGIAGAIIGVTKKGKGTGATSLVGKAGNALCKVANSANGKGKYAMIGVAVVTGLAFITSLFGNNKANKHSK